jgi:hypothetical protein
MWAKEEASLASTYMEEFGVRPAAGVGYAHSPVSVTGHHLVQHNVDAAHVLAIQGAKIMPGAIAQAGVGVHVLNDVADVLHLVSAAPVPNTATEVVTVQGADYIHVGVANFRRPGATVVPEANKQGKRGLALTRGAVLPIDGACQGAYAVELPAGWLRVEVYGQCMDESDKLLLFSSPVYIV